MINKDLKEPARTISGRNKIKILLIPSPITYYLLPITHYPFPVPCYL
ncbi:MAG: hypothetical protein ACRCU2_30310 [Planktothrix sp.]